MWDCGPARLNASVPICTYSALATLETLETIINPARNVTNRGNSFCYICNRLGARQQAGKTQSYKLAAQFFPVQAPQTR